MFVAVLKALASIAGFMLFIFGFLAIVIGAIMIPVTGAWWFVPLGLLSWGLAVAIVGIGRDKDLV